MHLFVRESSTVVVEVPASATVEDLKALWSFKAFGVASTQCWALLHNGRALRDASTLAAAGVCSGDALHAHARARGGGGDGGSTGAESRSCYLEMYAGKKADKVDPAEELLARWTRCHLSGERLQAPIVADELGSLYNKEAIVRALLARALPPALAHITSLKQLVDLRLDPVPRKGGAGGGNGAGVGAGGKGGGGADAVDFQCPLTGLEMNGRARFVAHRPTGRVVSERALKEAPAAAAELFGGAAAAQGDLIPLCPAGDELLRLREALAAKLSAERAKKLAKKLAKRGGAAAGSGGGASGGGEAAAADGSSGGNDNGSGGEARDASSPGDTARPAAAGAKRPAPAAAASGAPAAAAAGAAAAGAAPAAKKLKVPEGATPGVYQSIFHTAAQAAAVKETFTARAVSGRWRC